MIRKNYQFLYFSIAIIFLFGCRNYSPKPYEYPKFIYPQKKYIWFDNNETPFRFKIPHYAQMIPDQSEEGQKHWYNLNFEPFQATLHLSYKSLNNKDQYNKLMEESYILVQKHNVKASNIIIRDTTQPNGTYQLYYNLKGNTATPINIIASDKEKNYFRAAFYFNNATERDSILPIENFLIEDLKVLMNTFEWK